MTTKELRKRRSFRCNHGHNGLAHPQCFFRNETTNEKIGYWDLECSSLKADFGCVLSYCVLSDEGKMYERVITEKEIRAGIYDKDLLKDLCRDLLRFDRIIGYYSSHFDAPFARTRCLLHNIDFPTYAELKHTDAYYVVKAKLNLHSKRLGVVAPFFGIPAKGHPLNPSIWLKCLSGDKKALDWVLTHNREDVESLRSLWHKINPYIHITKTTI